MSNLNYLRMNNFGKLTRLLINVFGIVPGIYVALRLGLAGQQHRVRVKGLIGAPQFNPTYCFLLLPPYLKSQYW